MKIAYFRADPPLSAAIVWVNVEPADIETRDPSVLVGGTNVGPLEQEPVDKSTFTRNCSGTLLIGVVSLGLAKSSICSATA